MVSLLVLLLFQTSPELSEVEAREVRCVQAAMIAGYQLERDGEEDAFAVVMPVIAFNKGRLLARRPDMDWNSIITINRPDDLMDDPVVAIRTATECQDELNEIVWPKR